MNFAIFCQRFFLRMFCIAVIKPKSNVGIVAQKIAHTLNLIIGQCVHRINNNCPHTAIGEGSLFLFTQECINNRNKKAFRFTGASTRCNNKVVSLICLLPFLTLAPGVGRVDALI